MRFFFLILSVLLGGFSNVQLAYADGGVVINEALVHPSTGNKEWVEFYTSDVDLNNYWIDDDTDFTSDAGSSSKKQITNPVQGADTHHVVFELTSPIFNNDGDSITLFSPDGQIVDSYHYTNDPGVDMTIGRSPDGTGDFSTLTNPTRGSANSVSKPPDTPTPAPTVKPTKAPKASMTSSSSTATQTGTNTNAAVAAQESDPTSAIANVTETSRSASAGPTSILGIATKAAEKRHPVPTAMVQGTSTSKMPLVMTSFGGLFILSCGILIYLKKRGMWS